MDAAMPRAVRFKQETEERLKRATQRRRVTPSEYIRTAVEEKLDRDEPVRSSWDIAKKYCGMFQGDDPLASRRDVGEIIREKHRRIRARYDRRSD